MPSPVFIGSVALVAGYLAARRHGVADESAATGPSEKAPDTGESKPDSAPAIVAAAATPGHHESPMGGLMEADGHGIITDPIREGSTSLTPSGAVIAGSTSCTPSSGPGNIAGIGSTLVEVDGSPSGPSVDAPAPTADTSTLSIRVKYGSTSGLTRLQESAALADEGPGLGLVW